VTVRTGLNRALVVDDSAVIRGFVRTVLEAEGYAVDDATTVAAALTLQPASYDLLVIDVHLGSGSGTDIIDILRSQNPELLKRCILLTGEAIDKLPKDVRTMQKPVGVRTFIYTIRQVKSSQHPA
jgi:DNA-binding response OmpR family regulator